MRTRMAGVTLLAAAVALIAMPSGAVAQKQQRDVITREEILKSAQRDQDLLAVIQALRPHFLQAPRGMRTLGGTGAAPLAVIVDKIRQPGADVLQQLMANTVSEVRYLDPSRSQNEYGITANGGAIVVKRYIGPSLADSLKRKPLR